MATSNISPNALNQGLRGIDFPADKQDLVQQARTNNADDALIRELQSMPDKQFNSMNDVTNSLGGKTDVGQRQGKQGGSQQSQS